MPGGLAESAFLPIATGNVTILSEYGAGNGRYECSRLAFVYPGVSGGAAAN
jgi:hypothetical protein